MPDNDIICPQCQNSWTDANTICAACRYENRSAIAKALAAVRALMKRTLASDIAEDR